jgi:hypothetical protein
MAGRMRISGTKNTGIFSNPSAKGTVAMSRYTGEIFFPGRSDIPFETDPLG